MYVFLVLCALCRVNRQNEGRSQCRCSKDKCRERPGGGGTGQVGSKKKHTSTQERKHCLPIHFHPTNKPTNQKTYSPSVIASQRITWQKKGPKQLWLLQDIRISLALEGIAGVLPGITPLSREKAFYGPVLRKNLKIAVCMKQSCKTNLFKNKQNQNKPGVPAQQIMAK